MSSRVLHRRRGRMEPGFNLTPMLDMIFYLLFFFILATKIRDETESRMDVRLPTAASAARAPEREAPPAITLNAQGRIFFKDRPVVREELALELGHLLGKGQQEIAIRGDERVDYGRVIEVMDWCKLAGMKSVTLDLRRPLRQSTDPKE